MAKPKPELSKTQKDENAKHEKKIRTEVNRVKAIDEFGANKGEIKDALDKCREVLKALKESRGEKYDKDDIKEIASKVTPTKAKPSGNNQVKK